MMLFEAPFAYLLPTLVLLALVVLSLITHKQGM